MALRPRPTCFDVTRASNGRGRRRRVRWTSPTKWPGFAGRAGPGRSPATSTRPPAVIGDPRRSCGFWMAVWGCRFALSASPSPALQASHPPQRPRPSACSLSPPVSPGASVSCLARAGRREPSTPSDPARAASQALRRAARTPRTRRPGRAREACASNRAAAVRTRSRITALPSTHPKALSVPLPFTGYRPPNSRATAPLAARELVLGRGDRGIVAVFERIEQAPLSAVDLVRRALPLRRRLLWHLSVFPPALVGAEPGSCR